MTINRLPMPDSDVFAQRKKHVKWPTIRRAWLTDASVGNLERSAKGQGRSIIFLDGMYKTNLNMYAQDHSKRDPIERAVFFEWMVKNGYDQFFLLCWIGNFHNGSIFHCAYQFPQMFEWQKKYGDDFLEKRAFKVYKRIVEILYEHSDDPMDFEVKRFIEQEI